jgi:hypothetical protein
MWVVFIATFLFSIGGHIFVHLFLSHTADSELEQKRENIRKINYYIVRKHSLLITGINKSLSVEDCERKM